MQKGERWVKWIIKYVAHNYMYMDWKINLIRALAVIILSKIHDKMARGCTEWDIKVEINSLF